RQLVQAKKQDRTASFCRDSASSSGGASGGVGAWSRYWQGRHEPPLRPFNSHLPTNFSRRLSAGSGVGCCCKLFSTILRRRGLHMAYMQPSSLGLIHSCTNPSAVNCERAFCAALTVPT